MNLRQIEVFRAMMLAGSVTDAARLLHVSQPGVSRMLAHIELQLGLRLFVRSRGKLRPTPEAQALFSEVEQVYRGVQRIDDRARALKEGGGLTLRVLASPSTALQVVPRAVAALAAQFPGARIYMETQLVREMVGQLARGEADIAISTLPIAHALLASDVVGSWSMACVFATGHAFGQRRRIPWRDVLAEPLVAFSPDTPQGQLISQECAGTGMAPRTQIEVRAGQTACALVAAGAGVSVVDDLTARTWEGRGVEYRALARTPAFDAFAVYNTNAPLSVLAQAFTDHVRAAFKAVRRVSA